MALCALDGCDNKAAKRATHCSLACAEAQIKNLRNRLREMPRRFSSEDLAKSGYAGEDSDQTIRALRNPFGERTAAHVGFELFRESGHGPGLHREEIIDRLVERCHQKGIPLRSPRSSVRRTVTEIRSRGYELIKDNRGRLRLTGKRINLSGGADAEPS